VYSSVYDLLSPFDQFIDRIGLGGLTATSATMLQGLRSTLYPLENAAGVGLIVAPINDILRGIANALV
jgi:hypothetical protein